MSAIVKTSPGNRIVVKTQVQRPAQTAPAQNLSDLLDVDATNRSNNNTLVFDADSSKYVVKELPIINGGTF